MAQKIDEINRHSEDTDKNDAWFRGIGTSSPELGVPVKCQHHCAIGGNSEYHPEVLWKGSRIFDVQDRTSLLKQHPDIFPGTENEELDILMCRMLLDPKREGQWYWLAAPLIPR